MNKESFPKYKVRNADDIRGNLKNYFDSRVNHVMKTLKIKQKYFAARLKISSASLSYIENNKSRPGHKRNLQTNDQENMDINTNNPKQSKVKISLKHGLKSQKHKLCEPLQDLHLKINFFLV